MGRTRLWLMRVHQVKVAAKTITRIADDLGLPRAHGAKRRRGPRQLKLFEKATPGESVQVDVKAVIAGRKAYQYTASDDCIRLRVLRLYPRLNVLSSLGFLAQLVRAFPFPIRKIQTQIQTDNGPEFSLAFLGGRARQYSPPLHYPPTRSFSTPATERSPPRPSGFHS